MSKSAEYYFDYKIEKIFGDRAIKTPRLYFERDCEHQTYALYAVPTEWLGKQETVLKQYRDCRERQDVPGAQNALDKLEYDSVNVTFDIKGVECARLADISSEEYKNAEIKAVIKFDEFYERGRGRIFIENQNSQDHSGIGVLDMVKNGTIVARFFFAINFTFRKKIFYKLKIERMADGEYVSLEFECKDRPVGIPIQVVYNDRLPCLRNDMMVNQVGDAFYLDFTQGPIFNHKIKFPPNGVGSETVFSLTIPSENVLKYYMLDCRDNSSLNINKAKNTYPTPTYICPYCHKPIDYKLLSNPDYKKNGGITCQGTGVSDKNAKMPVITLKNGGKQKKCMYCASDLNDNGRFKPEHMRLLPMDFMEHNNFKIAFTGSTRAGKTTYISRFFDVNGNKDSVTMSANMLGSSLSQFGITSRPVFIPKLMASGDSYKLDETNWASTHSYYTERAISLDPEMYPSPTPHGDYTAYPFMMEINGKDYISFYDMAGEDAQTSTLINGISNGGLIGVFCIINGQMDTAANNAVITMLNDANLHKDTPIAVIVTKIDILEQQFDPNCRCLKTDYFDGTTTYEGSTLEYEIDYSSEEIKSFLKHENLLPDFPNYKNVKYFGTASFNFLDSIHWDLEDVNTPGKVKFECSSKRMELPFIWMLKQFGLIN